MDDDEWHFGQPKSAPWLESGLFIIPLVAASAALMALAWMWDRHRRGRIAESMRQLAEATGAAGALTHGGEALQGAVPSSGSRPPADELDRALQSVKQLARSADEVSEATAALHELADRKPAPDEAPMAPAQSLAPGGLGAAVCLLREGVWPHGRVSRDAGLWPDAEQLPRVFDFRRLDKRTRYNAYWHLLSGKAAWQVEQALWRAVEDRVRTAVPFQAVWQRRHGSKGGGELRERFVIVDVLDAQYATVGRYRARVRVLECNGAEVLEAFEPRAEAAGLEGFECSGVRGRREADEAAFAKARTAIAEASRATGEVLAGGAGGDERDEGSPSAAAEAVGFTSTRRVDGSIETVAPLLDLIPALSDEMLDSEEEEDAEEITDEARARMEAIAALESAALAIEHLRFFWEHIWEEEDEQLDGMYVRSTLQHRLDVHYGRVRDFLDSSSSDEASDPEENGGSRTSSAIEGLPPRSVLKQGGGGLAEEAQRWAAATGLGVADVPRRDDGGVDDARAAAEALIDGDDGTDFLGLGVEGQLRRRGARKRHARRDDDEASDP